MNKEDKINPLDAISPLDGRYAAVFQKKGVYPFSEGQLMKQRMRVECLWLVHLSEFLPKSTQHPEISEQDKKKLAELWQDDLIVEQIKVFEKQTNHDVKAVEYALRAKLKEMGLLDQLGAWLHFALTSEDVNNLAQALILDELRQQWLCPMLGEIYQSLYQLSHQYAQQPMLSRTHGQPASPTTMGKELAVFALRFYRQVGALQKMELLAKCNGAVGNYNAHVVAFPELPWIEISRKFVEDKLRLVFNPLTTQIENHDSLASFSMHLQLINSILIDLARDIWGYISLGYFQQKIVEGEVGSSTMPHKVNPIRFENAEGNLGLANSLFGFFAEKLPISRWQRDLSDSTVIRNMGVALGHSYIAYNNLLSGLSQLVVNQDALQDDLNKHWEVLAEAVQTVLRKRGAVDAYERLKDFSRGREIDATALTLFVEQQPELTSEDKAQLLSLTPSHYIGLADKLVNFLPMKIYEDT